MKATRSLREMTRILNTDQRIRKLCLIKDNQKGYTRSVMNRFSKRVGQSNLNRIIYQKVIKLLKSQQSSKVDVVLDASFIKAWSTSHPTDNQIGYSVAQARVGRSGRSYARAALSSCFFYNSFSLFPFFTCWQDNGKCLNKLHTINKETLLKWVLIFFK
jgi:hypothetical protein